MNAKLSQIFLIFTIFVFISTVVWLFWPSPYRICHIAITGLGRGNVYPKIAKFKPYKGKNMGGLAAMATVLKEEVASFSANGEPCCFLSLGAELSGTAESYMTKGAAVTKAFDAMGLDAMLVGNIDFSYGWKRLTELAKENKFKFLTSNVLDSKTNKLPECFSDELILELDQNLKIGLIGLSPVDTPNLTAKDDVAGLSFLEPASLLNKKVENLKNNGADVVVLLTQYNKEYISPEEWKVIASASPDICLMLDSDIETPIPFVKDGVIIYSVSNYNQTKELDFLNLEITKKRPIEIVGISAKRIGINLAEYDGDFEISKIVDESTASFRAKRDTAIGTFATDITKSYFAECPIGDMITDAMIAKTGAEIAFQNSGGIHNDIQEGCFTFGDLYSVMPFDNSVVTMELKGADILELLSRSASRKRGILQVSGLKYSYSYHSRNDYKLVDAFIKEEKINPDKYYKIVTNNFLAGGGDNYSAFTRGKNMEKLGSQRELVKNYIASISASGPIKIKIDGRIRVEE